MGRYWNPDVPFKLNPTIVLLWGFFCCGGRGLPFIYFFIFLFFFTSFREQDKANIKSLPWSQPAYTRMWVASSTTVLRTSTSGFVFSDPCYPNPCRPTTICKIHPNQRTHICRCKEGHYGEDGRCTIPGKFRIWMDGTGQKCHYPPGNHHASHL